MAAGSFHSYRAVGLPDFPGVSGGLLSVWGTGVAVVGVKGRTAPFSLTGFLLTGGGAAAFGGLYRVWLTLQNKIGESWGLHRIQFNYFHCMRSTFIV